MLPAAGVGREAVDRALVAEGWSLLALFPPRAAGGRRWVAAAGPDLVTLHDDPDLDLTYLEVTGLEVEVTVRRLRGHVRCHPPEEILARAEAGEPWAARALPLLGPEPLSGPWASALERASEGAQAAVAAFLERGLPSTAWWPHRPRLARRVTARIHLGDETLSVVLRDREQGLLAEVSSETWTLLRLADGTRDLDGLCLALADAGVYRGLETVRALLRPLLDAGLLEDGRPAPLPPPPVAGPAPTPPGRPLETLPGFRLRCDGGGSCCRVYETIPFREREAQHALTVGASLLPDGLPLALAFSPYEGAQRRTELLAVAQRGGRCVFLTADGACGLHRLGGPAAKPEPCRTYPATFLDDGVAVRIAPVPECACVFRSALEDGPGGAPLVPSAAGRASDLGAVRTRVLTDPVPLTATRTAPIAELRAVSERLAEALATRPPEDVASAALAAAEALEEGVPLARLSWGSAQDLSTGAVREALLRLGERCAQALEGEASCRRDGDLCLSTLRWVVAAVPSAEVFAPTDAETRRAEAFYLRALLFGHRVSLAGRPLAVGLRDRATRMLAARAMGRARPARTDPAVRFPLAVLEATLRALGLTSF